MGQRTFPALVIGGSAATFAAVFYLSGPTAAPAAPAAEAIRPESFAAAPAEPGMVTARDSYAPPASDTSIHYAGCNEVRAAGKAPLYAGQPGYREGMDGDGDGIACEPHSGGGDDRSGGRRRSRRY